MLSVSSKTKELFKSDSIHKDIEVTLYDSNGNLHTFGNDLIYSESLSLEETILDGSNMTFMGCYSNELQITLRNINNLKENAFNESPISVTITPYEKVPTKNKMPNYLPINTDISINGLSYTINSDKTITLHNMGTDVLTEDTTIQVSDFLVMEGESGTYLLSGCPSNQGILNTIQGAFYVIDNNNVLTVYNDVGDDVVVTLQKGYQCRYVILACQGYTVPTLTFKPMLRLQGTSNEYEPFGTKSVAADTVPLFSGYVESGQYHNDKSWLKITAYDVLYFLQSFNVWNWYKMQAFASGGNKNVLTNLDTVLERFADYVNTESGYEFELSETRCPVILSDAKIKRRLKNTEMTATNFLKAFCQLACGCAIIDRYGKLQIIYLNANSVHEEITYYRNFTSKDYVVYPFKEGITIRTDSNDKGVTLKTQTSVTPGWDTDATDTYTSVEDDADDTELTLGSYKIENNGLVKKLNVNKRKAIINYLLAAVKTNYYKFKSYEIVCNGLPYVECGDFIKVMRVTYIHHDEEEYTVAFSTTINNESDEAIAPTMEVVFQGEDLLTYSGTYIQFLNSTATGLPLFAFDCPKISTKTGITQTNINDKITCYNDGETLYGTYSRYENGEYTDYDISDCLVEQGPYVYNTPMIIPAHTTGYISFQPNGPFMYTATSSMTYTMPAYEEEVKTVQADLPILNRKLKGIQAMTDTFSFEFENSITNFGGTTSGMNDTNIASDYSSNAGDSLTGVTVITLVSFDSQTGVLTTSSAKV